MVHQRIVLEVPPDIFEVYMEKRGNRTHAKALMDGMGIPYESPVQGRPKREPSADTADSLTSKALKRGADEGASLWAASFKELSELKITNDAKDATAKRERGQ